MSVNSRDRGRRSQELISRGFTREQVAAIWEAQHPNISPRVAFRWAHNLTQEQVADRWNALDPGTVTMTKARISHFECWPETSTGRRPAVAQLDMLARIYQTTARQLLTSKEYDLYGAKSQAAINRIDHRPLGDGRRSHNPQIEPNNVPPSEPVSELCDLAGDGILAAVRLSAEGESPRLEEILRTWDETMRRRDLFTLTGGMAATFLTPAAPATFSLPEFGPQLYAMCAQLTATYRQMDNMLGPHAVYGQAVDHHKQLIRWLRYAESIKVRKHLSALAVDAGGLASWLCLDLEQYDQAFHLARQSAAIAQEHDHDVGRQAYMVGRMSRILSECARFEQALQLADEAMRLAGSKSAAVLISWLAVTRAFIHACLGDDRSCRKDLDTAAQFLERAEGQPAENYLAFHDQAHLLKMQGLCLLKLGEHSSSMVTEGRLAIDRAFATWPATAVRASAEVLAARASARIAQREIPEAASLTGQAYRIAMRTQSPRNLRAVAHLRLRLRPYRHTDAVRDLDDQLAL
ncbi:hypothetical protein [Sphaerisporangium album]|uniref:hypothetical protein n=1 Tax=Sphaerisporangium album TaxID=509200 RepID=UPI0015F06D89|nr:hypothetical protein [Sphaerisporangium album]